MSRHDVPCLMPHCTAVVGWDPPLRTFFGQVFRRGRTWKWVGASAPRLSTVDELRVALDGYVAFGPELIEKLRRDQSSDV